MVSMPDRNNLVPSVPEWVNWLQAGLTTLLVVLFLVVMGKSRQQSADIRLLQERLQGLENARALDRTTGLEQQLRSTVERLQALERSSARLDAISAESSALRQELRQLRAAAAAAAETRSSEPTLAPLPPLKSEPGTP